MFSLCMPALIYLIYFVSHVLIDVYRGEYVLAVVEILIGIMVTFLLNMLCANQMDIVSWVIVSVPFILMTVTSIILITAFKPPEKSGHELVDPYAIPVSGRVDFHGVQGKSQRPESSNSAPVTVPQGTATNVVPQPSYAPSAPTNAAPAPQPSYAPSATTNSAPAPQPSYAPSATTYSAPAPQPSYAPSATTYSAPAPQPSYVPSAPTYSPNTYSQGLVSSSGQIQAVNAMIDNLDFCDVPQNNTCAKCGSSQGKDGHGCMWCARSDNGSGGICRDVTKHGTDFTDPQKLALSNTTCRSTCAA